jgi:hypothetical protein
VKALFAESDLARIIDQSLVFQCACPAQVSATIVELRDLHRYQMLCAGESDNDRRVHEAIAAAALDAHARMEVCLRQVLEIEGWDLDSMTMPDSLKKRPAKPV